MSGWWSQLLWKNSFLLVLKTTSESIKKVLWLFRRKWYLGFLSMPSFQGRWSSLCSIISSIHFQKHSQRFRDSWSKRESYYPGLRSCSNGRNLLLVRFSVRSRSKGRWKFVKQELRCAYEHFSQPAWSWGKKLTLWWKLRHTLRWSTLSASPAMLRWLGRGTWMKPLNEEDIDDYIHHREMIACCNSAPVYNDSPDLNTFASNKPCTEEDSLFTAKTLLLPAESVRYFLCNHASKSLSSSTMSIEC